MNSLKKHRNTLKNHYSNRFSEFGATVKGVDWGDENKAVERYKNMLAIERFDPEGYGRTKTLLDVGCGYGELYSYVTSTGVRLQYHGIDIVQEMVDYASQKNPEIDFQCVDIFDYSPRIQFDYVVCNGILTQKLDLSILDMDKFAEKLLDKMFGLCSRGIAFNVMSTKVNFMVDNLYYKSPVELLAFCLNSLSEKVVMNHVCPRYEYTMYVYK